MHDRSNIRHQELSSTTQRQIPNTPGRIVAHKWEINVQIANRRLHQRSSNVDIDQGGKTELTHLAGEAKTGLS